MAISQEIDVIPSAMWPQGDIRDPLGVWGARLGITGDASAGTIKVGFVVPVALAGAYVYTIYGLTATQLTGVLNAGALVKSRVLTNWPDIDPLAGIQGFGTVRITTIGGSSNFTPPTRGPLNESLVDPLDRFLLLLDPRNRSTTLTLAEVEWFENVDLATYSFEVYGYFWDRSVADAPGGLRHPGSS